MVRPVDDFEDEEFDEDDDDRRPLSLEEIDLEYERLTSRWSPLEKFAARVGIIEGLTRAGRDLHSTALGKYDVVGEIARGGMGVVFEALDRELGRSVALKLWYEPTGAPDEKIRQEAMNLARLNHPNVVVVHEVDRVEDLFYMAMEFVRGDDLRARLREAIAWRDAVRLLIEAGRGLAAAHEAGLVHGDFKPENVLVGEDGRVRVADFGVARAMESEAAELERAPGPADRPSSDSPVGGTPAYMAPERLAGRRGDARSDQFSFCVTLWEAIFGQRPFSGATELALWTAITTGRPTMERPMVGISGRLVAALRRGLSPLPKNRFASMPELLAELERCLLEPERRRQRRRAKTTVAVSLIVGLTLGAAANAWVLRYTKVPQVPREEPSSLDAPRFANLLEVVGTFEKWRATEPEQASLEFANTAMELGADIERAAQAFEGAGNIAEAITATILAETTLCYAFRHYQRLGLDAEERKARNRDNTLLRAIERLTGSDESAKIELNDARLGELGELDTQAQLWKGSPP